MLANHPPSLLLASPDPALLAAVEPVLLASGARVKIVLSAQAALQTIAMPNLPDVVLLDANLPGMPFGQLLVTLRADHSKTTFPIVLIANAISDEILNRLAEGVIDDLILRSCPPEYWRLRIDQVFRGRRAMFELDLLRESTVAAAQLDRLTGVYNRDTLLSLLFRETDRVQRLNSPLCLVLFDIDDFGHWNSRLGTEACDELLCMIVARTSRLLRSYDLLGRPGQDEFLMVLPGCATENALMLADRLRMDVFSTPFRVEKESIRLSACFGIAVSHGRSPVIVLREAEQALQRAREAGPENIQLFGDTLEPLPAPFTFFSSTSGDELLAW
jgi:two-component system cell cycle response regulator